MSDKPLPTTPAQETGRRTSGSLKAVAIVIGLMIGLLLATLISHRPMPPDPTPWQKEIDQAIAQAAQENKIVLLYATADWCPPCREMKRYLWPTPQVQQLLAERYLPVKLDLTDAGSLSPAQNEWIARLKIEPIPALYRINGQGQPIDQRIGLQETEQFLSWLRSPAPAPSSNN